MNQAYRDYCRSLLFQFPWIGSHLQGWYRDAETLHRLQPGHFYSPLADEASIEAFGRFDVGETRTLDGSETCLLGIDLQDEQQLALVNRWHESGLLEPSVFQRYVPNNDYFGFSDALVLSATLRDRPPQRIVEIGAGFSTRVILDQLDAMPNHDTQVTVIDPDCNRLKSAMKPGDGERLDLRERSLQQDDVQECEALGPNDILMVDSSHVYKIGSDVQMIFEQLLPVLSVGVRIHFHDIFYPFDYPISWLRRGHHFNESYILRAFLQFNSHFRITVWNDWLRWQPVDVPDPLHLPADVVASSFWMERCE